MGTRIQICGSVVVQVDDRRIDRDLPGRQGQLLLVYLAANRDRAVTRDELIEALWPRELPARPESALSVLVSKLRSVLGPASIEGRSQLRLALTPVSIDLEDAAKAIHDAESAVGREDWAGAWGPARVALHTSRRGLLHGFDAPWILELRARLDDIQLRALASVAVSSLRMGGPELPSAERAARSLVTLAPFRETGHLFLMEALAAQGNTAEALRVFDDLRRLLNEELGTAPGRDLQALHRRLLGEGGPAPGHEGSRARIVLFTDLEGSTALAHRLGDDGAFRLLRIHDGIVREALARHDGKEVKHTGDGIMASLGSVQSALQCAVDVQRGLAAHNDSNEPALKVRIGISAGEPVVEGDDLFGATVQLAARLCDHAEPGTILVSGVVRDLSIGKGFTFGPGWEASLKGFPQPVALCELAWSSAP
jgi:class 3 adenylate cyclase